jgi:hypothetical protein
MLSFFPLFLHDLLNFYLLVKIEIAVQALCVCFKTSE